MAISAADRPVLAGAGLAVLAALIVVGSCSPASTPTSQPAPVAAPEAPAQPAPKPEAEPTPLRPGQPPAAEPDGAGEPQLRIGLAAGVASATIGGAAELTVMDPSGASLAAIPAGEQWRVIPSGTGISVQPPGRPGSTPSEMLVVITTDATQLVRVNGRGYRGVVEIVRGSEGLTIVNRLLLESYLTGVVSAEMGRRTSAEFEALKAQAVASRTYAVRNRGRRRALGFDLHAGVADQVYIGAGSETPEGVEAVRATRGMALTWQGAPVDAFYYSTCGGQTAEGVEAFAAASRPYLQSLADVDEAGQDYCRISPRYRWREEWIGDALRSTLSRTLPVATKVRADQVSEVRDVWVAARSPSGRVARLGITLRADQVMVTGQAIRQVLRPPSGELLRSSAFTLTATGTGRSVGRLVADGRGAGHGVGMCQWGAVGRSRAGHDFQRILAAYYPGASVQRIY